MFLLKLFILFYAKFTIASFLGGTVYWMVFNNEVRFVYRLTWENGTGPCGTGCNYSNLNTSGVLPPNLASLRWRCTSGCDNITELHDVNYRVTSLSTVAPGWEQGEDFFFVQLPMGASYTVQLDNIPLENSVGRLVTSLDLRIRNDTNLTNASPITAVPPFVGLQFGCTSTIRLPVDDPDADRVRCRLAKPEECGASCTNIPSNGLTIDMDDCTIIVNAQHAHGINPGDKLLLTIMVEDMPHVPFMLGDSPVFEDDVLSKIPLQVTVFIIDTGSCGIDDVVFANPVIPDGTRISYAGLPQVYYDAHYLEASDISSVEYMASFTSGTFYEIFPDDLYNRQNVSRIYSTWIPYIDQAADALHCVWGRRPDGVTTDKSCLMAIAYDNDDCMPNPCHRNGTCIDLYHRFTCRCPLGFAPPDCSNPIMVKRPPPVIPNIAEKEIRNWKVPVFTTIAVLAAAATTGCCWWFCFGGKRRKEEEEEETPKKKKSKTLKQNSVDTQKDEKSIQSIENNGDPETKHLSDVQQEEVVTKLPNGTAPPSFTQGIPEQKPNVEMPLGKKVIDSF